MDKWTLFKLQLMDRYGLTENELLNNYLLDYLQNDISDLYAYFDNVLEVGDN